MAHAVLLSSTKKTDRSGKDNSGRSADYVTKSQTIGEGITVVVIVAVELLKSIIGLLVRRPASKSRKISL